TRRVVARINGRAAGARQHGPGKSAVVGQRTQQRVGVEIAATVGAQASVPTAATAARALDHAVVDGGRGVVIEDFRAADSSRVAPGDDVAQAWAAGALVAIVVHRAAVFASAVAAEGDVAQARAAGAACLAIVVHCAAVAASAVVAEGDVAQARAADAATNTIVVHRAAVVVSGVAAECDVAQVRAAGAAFLAIVEYRAAASASAVVAEGDV